MNKTMNKRKVVKVMRAILVTSVITMAIPINVMANQEVYIDKYESSFASEIIGTPIEVGLRNVAISTCSTSLSITGSTANCTGTVSFYANQANSATIKLSLQQQLNGTWNTIESWSSTIYSIVGSLSKSKTIGNGTYRVKGEFSAGGESIVVYSATKIK